MALFYILEAQEPVCPSTREEFTDPNKSTTVVVWKDPAAKDINGKDLDITCMPPSGSEFPIEQTEVVCMAGDSKEENYSCTFTVNIIVGKLRKLII